jgi:hypothetical protein
MEREHALPAGEPGWHEALDDTIVQIMMRRDGVRREEVLDLLRWAQTELRRQGRLAAAVRRKAS